MDRDYILNVLTAIGCPEIITSLISIIYTDTKAMIEIGGYLSRSIRVDNRIKQGCPLSALLFILGMEPLLQAIRYNNSIKSAKHLKLWPTPMILVFSLNALVSEIYLMKSISSI